MENNFSPVNSLTQVFAARDKLIELNNRMAAINEQVADIEKIPESLQKHKVQIQMHLQTEKNELLAEIDSQNKIIAFAEKRMNEPTSVGTQTLTEQGTVICNNIEHKLSSEAKRLLKHFRFFEFWVDYYQYKQHKQRLNNKQQKMLVDAITYGTNNPFYFQDLDQYAFQIAYNPNSRKITYMAGSPCNVFCSYPTFAKYLNELVVMGIVEKRANPHDKKSPNYYLNENFKYQFATASERLAS